mgnify:CR=1 FL=1
MIFLVSHFTQPFLFTSLMLLNRLSVSESFVKDVLSKDEVFLGLTKTLTSSPYSKYVGQSVRLLQERYLLGQLSRQEQDYLEMITLWKQRLDYLRFDYFKSCFSL